MKKEKPSHLLPSLWKLILICCTASFSALLPANAIPSIAHHFSVSAGNAEGVLTWFLFGGGFGPLLYGPIANRYGRKKALLFGLGLALLASILSLVAIAGHNLELLLISRLLEGIGTSVGITVGMIIIADTCEEKKARHIFSLVVLFFSFAPAIAMATGGILTEYISLSSVFIFLLLMMIVWIFIILSIKETYQDKPVLIHWGKISRQYARALFEKPYIFLALMMAMATAAMYVYNGIGPIIAITQLHISAATFGELAIIPSLGLFVGALLSSRLSHRISATATIYWGIAASLLASIIMFIFFKLHYVSLSTLLVPAVMLFLGAAIVIPNAAMVALIKAKNSGVASSVMNAMAILISAVILSITSSLIHYGSLILPLSLLVISILAIILLLVGIKNKKD